MQGNKQEVFSRGEELREMGLNVPQITELILELEKHGIYLGRDIYTVEDAEKALLKLFGGHKL